MGWAFLIFHDKMSSMVETRITFVTPIKGRLHHLRQTYLQNINNAAGLPVRFHLVNLDSPDGLDDWVKKELAQHLKSGLVSYFRAVEPYPVYRIAHADNAAFLTATTPVVSNMMADNFCTKEYFEQVCSHADQLEAGNSIAYMEPWFHFATDTGGRLTLSMESFVGIGGYEELLIHWGNQDVDMFKRAEASGLKPIPIPKGRECSVEHGDDERARYDTISTRRVQRNNAMNIRLATRLRGERGEVANHGRSWGVLDLYRGFTDEVISVGVNVAQK
jgi:hypothetical protein